MALKQRQQREPIGIFGPAAHRWRGSILRMELTGEGITFGRLRSVRDGHAELEMLDPANLKAVVAQRTVDWPPDGAVTVIRTAI